MRTILTLVALLTVVLVGPGCSTPPPVKDTSALTASMMKQATDEVDKYRTAVEVGNAQIVATVSTVMQSDVKNRLWLDQHVRFDTAAGNTQRVTLFMQMKALSESLLDDDEALQAAQTKITADMAGLLKPLPSAASKLSSATSAVLVLGEDRSAKAQFEEAVAAWKAVAATTKDNRDKLKKATEPDTSPKK